jgi:hypothetical protein
MGMVAKMLGYLSSLESRIDQHSTALVALRFATGCCRGVETTTANTKAHLDAQGVVRNLCLSTVKTLIRIANGLQPW